MGGFYGVRGSEIWNTGKMAAAPVPYVALTQQAKDAMAVEIAGNLKSVKTAAQAF